MSYVCTECNKEFTTKQSLRYHVNKKVCENLDHHCKYCNKGFTSVNSMYRHIRSVCAIKKENDKVEDNEANSEETESDEDNIDNSINDNELVSDDECVNEQINNMQKEIETLKRELKLQH